MGQPTLQRGRLAARRGACTAPWWVAARAPHFPFCLPRIALFFLLLPSGLLAAWERGPLVKYSLSLLFLTCSLSLHSHNRLWRQGQLHLHFQGYKGFKELPESLQLAEVGAGILTRALTLLTTALCTPLSQRMSLC